MADPWPDGKSSVLKSMTFGARIAEDEATELSGYFIETDQWNRLYRGDIDVVYGAKGSGKSAMFALLLSREDALFDRRILLVPVEDPRGAPVFSQLVADPPTTEAEFRALWKLYLLTLIGRQLREYRVGGRLAGRVVSELEAAGLLSPGSSLRRLLHTALRYVRAVTSAATLEATVNVDHATGMPSGVTGKILFREPDQEEHEQYGLVSVDEVMELADRALLAANLRVWLVLDRLDVAFSDSEDLETNALRALFRVYAGLRRLEHISLKVFLRSDIWERVTRRGFREASHVTKTLTIAWTHDSLLHLIVRRLVRNDAVRLRYGLTGPAQLSDIYQRHLFNAICQRRTSSRHLRRPDTFEWILSLVSDGTGVAEPRELIHLFNAARDAQVRRLEMGQAMPAGETLLDLASFGEALTEVSYARLQQTIYAEHPRFRPWIQRLHGGRMTYTLRHLASAWSINDMDAGRRAEALVGIGVLGQSGSRKAPVYRVPMLYRPALGLLSGVEWVKADH
jgi:hypothetical protein